MEQSARYRKAHALRAPAAREALRLADQAPTQRSGPGSKPEHISGRQGTQWVQDFLYREDCTIEATEIAGSDAACLLVVQCHPRGPAARSRTVA
jgi:hypothetical protein